MRREVRVMLDLSIHSGAESEALGAPFCVVSIIMRGAQTFGSLVLGPWLVMRGNLTSDSAQL